MLLDSANGSKVFLLPYLFRCTVPCDACFWFVLSAHYCPTRLDLNAIRSGKSGMLIGLKCIHTMQREQLSAHFPSSMPLARFCENVMIGCIAAHSYQVIASLYVVYRPLPTHSALRRIRLRKKQKGGTASNRCNNRSSLFDRRALSNGGRIVTVVCASCFVWRRAQKNYGFRCPLCGEMQEADLSQVSREGHE